MHLKWPWLLCFFAKNAVKAIWIFLFHCDISQIIKKKFAPFRCTSSVARSFGLNIFILNEHIIYWFVEFNLFSSKSFEFLSFWFPFYAISTTMHWALLLCRLFFSLELELNFKSMHETHNINIRTVSSYRKFSPLYNWFEIVYGFFGNRVSYTLFLSQTSQEGFKYTKAKE